MSFDDSILPFAQSSFGPRSEKLGSSWMRLRSVRLWLAILTFLVFVMVLVGGMTRLTDSGLSITEWKPVVGAVPPMSEQAWSEEFNRYRATSQYELMNRGMSLSEFKRIYWWEWTHRQLGRFIGAVYLVGLVGFAIAGKLTLRLGLWLFAGGLLLGLQGLVGWIMVASGLKPGMIAVAPVKLSLHLTLASLFFAFLIATHARLGGSDAVRRATAGTVAAWLIAVAALVQIALGGLVAGHDAGLTYNTWPLMDGRFVPAGLLAMQPLWHNFTDNITTVQFDHRIGGYVLATLVIGYGLLRLALRRWSSDLALIMAVVIGQVALGILALILVVPWPIALAHQAMALILFGLLVRHAARPASS
ncbi:COX15/CtaA family protein [Afifella aestuarii]|uniref:COX15/CtaA family protein n=1 Tax=Afifella aestuarii TaxID=1909496 RepID=UPI001FEAD21C|nr:COX15/CtaA family protein [Afifella aestuarii]